MRLTTSFAAWLAVFACSAELSYATIAYVLTFDPLTAQSKHQIALTSLPPDVARLILAQRVGAEDYHLLSTPRDGEIELINKYGAKSSIFQSTTPDKRAFLIAELPEEHEAHTMLRLHARFTISDVPDLDTTLDLMQDLYSQTHQGKHISRATLQSKASARGDSPSFHVASDGNALVELARELAADKVSVTALLLPAGKRSTTWGTYEMPKSKSKSKRQVPHRLEPEEPLEIDVRPHAVVTLANSSNSSSNYTYTKPLKGILPACYSSRQKCDSTTRGCMGHGQCKLKWTNTDSSQSGECWGCACSATKSKGLTTYWSGPACQKKDISVEFWLITLFTIGLVGLVSFAVGNLLNMGEQELPSVLGAGVSGPTARK